MKVLAGKYREHSGVIDSVWPVTYLDFRFSGMAKTPVSIPAKHNSLVYIYEGCLNVNGNLHPENSVLVFENSSNQENVFLEKIDFGKAGAILLSGLPIQEEIVWRGPFVLNTKEQLQKTYEDLVMCKNGFEDAKDWESKIKDLRFK